MNYPDDIAAGSNRNPEHTHSPFNDELLTIMRIESIASDIIDGLHDWSVEDVVKEIIYEDAELLARYKQGLQDIAIGSTCGHELHMVIDDAVSIAAKRIYEAKS